MNSHCSKLCLGYKEILQLLIDKGANINAVNRDNHTALDAAFEAIKSEGKIENNYNFKYNRIIWNFFLDVCEFHFF